MSKTTPTTGVMVHDVSLDLNPVPVTVISVADRLPSGGEPLAGLGLTMVTTGLTVKLVCAEVTPLLLVTERRYACPGAVAETMKLLGGFATRPKLLMRHA
jgi:hypothetical protein